MTTSETPVQQENGESLGATSRDRMPAQALATAATAATVTAANLVVYGIARAADVSVVMRTEGAAPHAVHVSDVVFASAVPLLVGMVLAIVLARLWAPVLRIAQVVGGGFGVLSAVGPLLSQSDGGTKATLATMHLLVGVAVILGLAAARRVAERS